MIGESADRFQWALDAAADAKGRCTGSQGIALIINKVQNVILAKGYVTTRVMAQEQNLTTGVLALTLQPGRIGEIRFEEPVSGVGGCGTLFRPHAATFSTCAISNRGWKTSGGCPAPMPTLKSSPAPRTAPVTCRSTGTKGARCGSARNGRQRLQKYRALSRFGHPAIDAPFAQNDLFYANIGKDMFQHGPLGNRSHTLNYFFPVGYWAFSANYNDYTYHQNIPNANEVLRYSGKSDNIQLTVSRLLYRDQSHKTTLNLRGYRRHSTNAVDDVDIVSQNVGPPVGSWGLTSAAISVPPRWMRISAGAAVLEHLMPCLHRKNRVMKAAPVPACCSATGYQPAFHGASSPAGVYQRAGPVELECADAAGADGHWRALHGARL